MAQVRAMANGSPSAVPAPVSPAGCTQTPARTSIRGIASMPQDTTAKSPGNPRLRRGRCRDVFSVAFGVLCEYFHILRAFAAQNQTISLKAILEAPSNAVLRIGAPRGRGGARRVRWWGKKACDRHRGDGGSRSVA